MSGDLLQTKLYVPRLRPFLVPRPHLTKQLNQGMQQGCKLTLVSAPAGFGKTTLLSEWITNCEACMHIAWLSLDTDDNDLTQFLTYLVAALQTIDKGIGQGVFVALQSPGTMNAKVILTLLLNEIIKFSHDVVLILDDYHVIESYLVDKAITFLLDHLPAQLHLVIASRFDPSLPLSRLRASGLMTEIRENDLRFTLDETAAFLNQLKGFNLSAKDIAALADRTEGWITGLQLAALAMQDALSKQGLKRSCEIKEFINNFTGSDRFIQDYLADEVLQQRPKGTRNFLLQTSILSRLSASLCDAVTKRNNSQIVLENLELANLFIVPLDNERRWYRYHHLFCDLLNRRLSQVFPEQIIELHQRACNWYQNKGEINEAVHHAMAAGNKEQAADILEDHWEEFFIKGEFNKLKHMLDSLGPEITNNSVPFRMAYCMMYSQTGAIKLIPGHLEIIRRRIEADIDRNIKQPSSLTVIPTLVETMEAVVALDNDQASKAKEHAKRGISLIPDDASPVDRRRLFLAASFRLGQAHKELGEYDEACSILLEVLEMLKATESYYVVSTVIQIVSMYQKLGRNQEALTLCEDTLYFVAEKHWEELPPVGLIHVALAGLQADAGDYKAAQENLDSGRVLLKQATTQEIISMIDAIETKLSNITPPIRPMVEPLSQRELEVLQLVAQGLSNREISERLFLALDTVKGHNHRIYGKLGVHRRVEAVERARTLGLL